MALLANIQGYGTGGQIEIKADVVDLSEFDAALAELGGDLVKAAAGALFREADGNIMAKSKDEVPWDTGNLVGTGHTDLPVYAGDEVSVSMGYNTPYALTQHERRDFHHDHGKAGYLGDPFDAAKAGMDERLAADIRTHVPQVTP